MTPKSILFLLLLSFLACSTDDDIHPSSKEDCVDTDCRDYTSQAAAQAAYDADPECRNDLDRDNDGIACEEPGNSVSTGGGGVNCPTTANCGCSGHNKAPCIADPCCKWVVGSGCECA